MSLVGTAQVYLCDPAAQGHAERALAWSWLDAEERERTRRFVFERDRLDYVVAHGLLREVLARHAGCAPASLRFARSATGKPELLLHGSDAPALRFNLSHSRGLVGCAVTLGNDVGFDLEHVALPAPLEIAARYFCPSELAGLLALGPAQRHLHFYELWTLKEAYMKATGLGLAMPLHSFAVEPATAQAGARLLFAAESAPCALHGWSFARHAAAIAVRCDASQLKLEYHRVERLGVAVAA